MIKLTANFNKLIYIKLNQRLFKKTLGIYLINLNIFMYSFKRIISAIFRRVFLRLWTIYIYLIVFQGDRYERLDCLLSIFVRALFIIKPQVRWSYGQYFYYFLWFLTLRFSHFQLFNLRDQNCILLLKSINFWFKFVIMVL